MKKIILILLAFLFGVSNPVFANDEKLLQNFINEVPENQRKFQLDSPYNLQNNYSESSDRSVSRKSHTTLMIYLCGSTLEEEGGSATDDLIEMINSGFNENEVNIIVMAGGSRLWQNNVIKDGKTGIYRIGDGYIETLVNYSKPLNMGNPTTLTDFLDYSVNNFPSKHYGLILWDHGGGSLGGIIHDTNYDGSYLNMNKLEQALKNSYFSKNKLDWIGFDACLMAAIETAKVISPYAHYMIASEESEPASGWDYSFLKGVEKDRNPEETGKRIMDTFARSSAQNSKHVVYLSCVNLDKISPLIKSIDNFFKSIKVSSKNFAALSRARRNVVSFGRDEEPKYDYDLADLGNMVNSFSNIGESQKGTELLKSLSEAVTCHIPEKPDVTGLSIYSPFYNKESFHYLQNIHKTLNFSSHYENYISDFGQYLLSNGSKTWSFMKTIQDVSNKAVHSRFRVDLSEEQLANFGTASLIALQKSADAESWHFVAVQEAVIENENTLTGDYVHTNLFFTDETGKPLHDTAIVYDDKGDGLIRIPVILVNPEKIQYKAMMVCSSDLKDGITFNPSENGTETTENILFYLYDEAIDGYSPRLIANPTDYSSVIYQVPVREKAYENDALLSFNQWKNVDTESYSLPLNKSWKLTYVENHLDITSLYVAFQVTDIFNNVYISEPIPLTGLPKEACASIVSYDDHDLVTIDSENFTANDLRFSAQLTNISDNEVILKIENVRVNDTLTDVEVEVFGSGSNWGLVGGERQPVSFLLSVNGKYNIENIKFDISIVDASSEEEIEIINDITVEISMDKCK